MKFIYGKQDFRSLSRAQENGFLLTNGLGGYASLSAAFSVSRCDHGVLIGAVSAPNVRATLVHRLSEKLAIGEREEFLSTQAFAGRKPAEEGYRHLSSFVLEYTPVWTYHVGGVQVTRRMAMAQGKNAAAVIYEIDNRSGEDCCLTVAPLFALAAKGDARKDKTRIAFDGRSVLGGGYRVFIRTDGEIAKTKTRWERLSYPDDAKDGRAASGLCAACCSLAVCAPMGESASLSIVFSMEDELLDARDMLAAQEARMRALEEKSGFADPVARRLALAADAYLSKK